MIGIYKMEKEIKHIGSIQLRSEGNSRRVEGYAVVFDSPSEDMGFIETIARGAITQDVLNNSDILFKFNHEDDKVLARWNKGVGSLSLELDDKGLKYSFDAPNTDLGNSVLEFLRRGDLSKSSFAFTLPTDDSCEKWEEKDGKYFRTIYRIDRLFDCACVWSPAYSETSCSQRALDALEKLKLLKINITDSEMKEIDELKDEIRAMKELLSGLNKREASEDAEEEKPEEKNCDEEEKERSCEADADENKEEKGCEEEPENSPEEKSDDSDEPKEEEKEQSDDDESDTEEKNTKRSKMEKKFSLLKAIKEATEHRGFSAQNEAVINAGADEMRKSGLAVAGQIQIPMEQRAAITVAAEGEDVVVTDFTNILEPLYAKNVLAEAGAQFITGLQGDVQIPYMTAGNCTWEGETSAASEAGNTFSHITMSPHRLTAYVDISKQFLVQDTLGAENMLRADLVNALRAKLETSILGDEYGANRPNGLAYNVTAEEVDSFSDITYLESKVEDAKIFGECKYIVSPNAKSTLRSMVKGQNANAGFVMERNDIDGTPALSTGNVKTSYMYYGDFSTLKVGQWGPIDITVDEYTQAVNGKVRLVINSFWDFKPTREGAIKYAHVTA